MTNKDNLQKELLEKVKPGTKPSDLKKKNDNQRSNKKQRDEGYESDSSNKSIPKAPPLPNNQTKELKREVEYWTTTANTHLKNLQLAQAKISNLEEQLKRKPIKSESEQLSEKNKQIEIIAKENEKNVEKIKKFQEQEKVWKETISKSNTLISEKDKTIQNLQNQLKNTKGSKGATETFTCYHCKNSQQTSLLVLELPEGKLCQSCWTILRKKTKQNLQNPVENKLFTCVVCDQEKQETPIYKKVEISYKPLIKGKEYPVCSSCSPHVKEYNKDGDRELEEWE